MKVKTHRIALVPLLVLVLRFRQRAQDEPKHRLAPLALARLDRHVQPRPLLRLLCALGWDELGGRGHRRVLRRLRRALHWSMVAERRAGE